jgi:methionine-rich copper-binding protein CopC
MSALQALVMCALLVTLATLSPALPVWSHAALVKSSPAHGASLTKSPAVIRAWFNEELTVKGSTMRLFDAHQKQLATGGLDASVSKHDVMKITPPALKPGAYVVQWTAISADDNDTRKGSFKFSIGAGAMASPGPTAGLPPIRLIAPASQATIKNPAVLVIETSGDISQMTMGGDMAHMSGMGSQVHLHINVDSMMIMPTAKQLTKVGPNRYEFRLPSMSPGTHTIKVYWADDKTHTPAGHVQTTMCTVTG